jgi:lipopolysaccharide transport system ATP-binding protein
MIAVHNLGKCYKRYPNHWARLGEWVTGGRHVAHEERWVLRGVSFAVAPGEAVGIIGHNGAGKSTLLKILTGTTRATEGTHLVDGQVSALLELGMGFHPDFTGRQNAIVGCQLLGLGAREIEARLPDIIEFAEIVDYLDQPLRTYSTGMQMRLAFSVATAIRPALLIIDEALAVGDLYFQLKCHERISDFVNSGTTLLLVSHSPEAILRLCSRALLLRHGALIHDGAPKEVVDLYQADLLVKRDARPHALTVTQPAAGNAPPPAAPPADAHPPAETFAAHLGAVTTSDATLMAVTIADRSGTDVGSLLSGSEVVLIVRYHIHRFLKDPHVGFKIRDKFGTVLFETHSHALGQTLGPAASGQHLECRFVFRMPLAPGEYSVTVGLANGATPEGTFAETLSYLHNVAAFTLLPDVTGYRWAGICDLKPRLSATIHQSSADPGGAGGS